MSTLAAHEQRLFDWAYSILPEWYIEQERPEEWLGASAKMIGAVCAIGDFWLSQTYILDAVGAVAGEPDWLGQHAIDRGTHRQEDEDDPALRERLRNPADALTRQALLDLADLMLSRSGVSGSAAMVELRRDKGYFGDFTSDTGTGGVFTAGVGDDMRFEPDAGFATFPRNGWDLVISGASSAGNDGTFAVTDVVADSAEFENASGVAEVDATCTWTLVKRHDVDLALIDGFAKTFLSRGYRMSHSGPPPAFIVILPYGTTAELAASVEEALRQRKGAGVLLIVEYRQSPP